MESFSPLTLRAEHLTRFFGDAVALLDLSMTATAGDLVEVIGANGSGKSTLLRILAGVLHPDQGSVRWEPAGTIRIAYVGHETQLFTDLTARETLELQARLAGRDLASSDSLLEHWRLGHVADQRVAGLSAGTRRRLAIARALAIEAPVLIIDEPFASLDTAARAAVVEALRRHCGDGGVAVISGHEAGVGFARQTRQVVLDGWRVGPLAARTG